MMIEELAGRKKSARKKPCGRKGVTPARGSWLHRNVGKGALRGSGGGSEDCKLKVAKPAMVDDAHTHGGACAIHKDVFGSLSQTPRSLRPPSLSSTAIDSNAVELDFKLAVNYRRNERCRDLFKMLPRHCQRERRFRLYLRRRNNLIHFG